MLSNVCNLVDFLFTCFILPQLYCNKRQAVYWCYNDFEVYGGSMYGWIIMNWVKMKNLGKKKLPKKLVLIFSWNNYYKIWLVNFPNYKTFCSFKMHKYIQSVNSHTSLYCIIRQNYIQILTWSTEMPDQQEWV